MNPPCFLIMGAVCVEELVGVEAVNIAPFLHLMPSSASDYGCDVATRVGCTFANRFVDEV